MTDEEFDPVKFIKSLDEMVKQAEEGKLVPGLVALGFVLKGEPISMQEYKEKRERAKQWHGKERRKTA